MNETYSNNQTQEYKTEDDNETCISDLSPSAIEGAVKLFDLADEAAFNSIFN